MSEQDTRLMPFLRAVGDHPWAALKLLQPYSGLPAWEINEQLQGQAVQLRLVERGDIPSPQGRAPRRFGLTPNGAAAIGRTWSLAELRRAFWRALHLDLARKLLAEWLGPTPRTIWSLSPFMLPAEAIRPLNSRRPVTRESRADFAYRSLRLDGLACLAFNASEYLNVALWVDPGGINLTWFFHQFRGVYAWRRRPEFQGRERTLPMIIVVAATEARRVRLTQLWRTAAIGVGPLSLRLTTRAALALPEEKRSWWNERGQQTALWGGALTFNRPSLRPVDANSSWWAEVALNDIQADPQRQPYALSKKRLGLLAWSDRETGGKTPAAKFVRIQRKLCPLGRNLLRRIGMYPLLKASELALVTGIALPHVLSALQALTEHGLIAHPSQDEREHLLTWDGLALLAVQAGYPPNEYAELMRWPVGRDSAGQPCYSVDVMLSNYEHTRRVLEFLVGLRRYGPAQRLSLRIWDHVQCVQDFPLPEPHPALSQLRFMNERIIPDAKGRVRAFGDTPMNYADTSFWLEVDLGTHQGTALAEKLERYYTAGGPRVGIGGRGVRILIVVGGGDDASQSVTLVRKRSTPSPEARLQDLRRRLLALNAKYHTQLAVWLTRVDLLEDRYGRLDPTRLVWRSLESSQFVSAFLQLGQGT